MRFLQFECQRVKLVLSRTGDLRRERRRLLHRQLAEQDLERAPRFGRVRVEVGRSAFDDQHELAFYAVGMLGKPRPGFGKRALVDRFEKLRELARDDDAPLAEMRREVSYRFDDAMRRFV